MPRMQSHPQSKRQPKQKPKQQSKRAGARVAAPALLRDPQAPLTRAALSELSDDLRARAKFSAEPGDTPTDRLFGAIMAQIDIMQARRADYLWVRTRLLQAPPVWPSVWASAWPPVWPWCLAIGNAATTRMLQELGLLSRDGRRFAQRAGLLAVMAVTVRAWARDDSPDLTVTMRVLDNGLRRVATAAAWLGLTED